MASTQTQVYNFSAGPGVLPSEVLAEVRDELVNYRGCGMSVMEMSHRGKDFLKIAEQTEADLRELMGIPANYKVMFLQGGASLQFTMLAMNFLRSDRSADYVVTGAWGDKAFKAAQIEGSARLVFDDKGNGYRNAPDLDSLAYADDSTFVHFTSNETIQGVEFGGDPTPGRDWICDMSSNIASRPLDVSRYAMIYAGAQKNLGPAGVALVIMREDLLERVPAGLPPMLDYKVQAESDWMYNTPPTFAVYVCGKVFRHWLNFGGLAAVEQLNAGKAKAIYDAIAGSGGFYGAHADASCRSRMNIPFTLPSEELTGAFVKEATAAGFLELKGHRSVGGCRASVYNAFPMAGVHALCAFMNEFATKNG